MNIRVQQLNPVIGDIEGNTRGILSALEKAGTDAVDLLILPELCTCGYPPMDLLERPAFREAINRANDQIIAASDQTAIIFGSVTRNTSNLGRSLYNSALMAQRGEKIAEIHKALLPTYDVYDEDRYFERGDNFGCVDWNGKKLGITICEDIWANYGLVQYHTYKVNPVQELAAQGADAIINVSASPFTLSKAEGRPQMLRKNNEVVELPIFYANQVGGNTELISDGDSIVMDKSGKVVARAPLFKEAYIDVVWSVAGDVEASKKNPIAVVPAKEERVFQALQCGLKQYLGKTGVTNQVVLGLSGGIDSTVVACIAAEALGPENVLGIAMPSDFSSAGSITDAQQLADNLGIEIRQLPIKSLYESYLSVLEPLFEGTDFGVAEENIQSRARGMLLMAIANKFNRFVLNPGNKSELATGYCTLYGDMNGALSVIGDLYKTEVYEIAQWMNKSFYKEEVIPRSVLEKAPSAELKPGQKDTDRLPAYHKLDSILKLYIEDQISVTEIQKQGFDQSLVHQIVRMVDKNEHKRYQAPPVLKIHTKSFGSGRRWPLVHNWTDNSSGNK